MAPAAQTIRTAELRRGADTDRAAEPSRTPSEPQPGASGDENKVRELRGPAIARITRWRNTWLSAKPASGGRIYAC